MPIGAPSREQAGRTAPERTPIRRATCWSISGSSRTRVDALATSALEHASGLRAAELEFDADNAVRVALAIGRGDAQMLAVRRESDEDEPRIDELAQPAATRPQERLELELAGERVADLVEGLEVAQPAGRGFVQASVLDRDGGLGGEQLRSSSSSSVKLLAARLLGQIQVSVRDSAEEDRHAEERSASAGGCAETRPSAGRRRCRGAAAAARRGSGRRGCRVRAADRRSPRAVSASIPSSGSARAPVPVCR